MLILHDLNIRRTKREFYLNFNMVVNQQQIKQIWLIQQISFLTPLSQILPTSQSIFFCYSLQINYCMVTFATNGWDNGDANLHKYSFGYRVILGPLVTIYMVYLLRSLRPRFSIEDLIYAKSWICKSQLYLKSEI